MLIIRASLLWVLLPYVLWRTQAFDTFPGSQVTHPTLARSLHRVPPRLQYTTAQSAEGQRGNAESGGAADGPETSLTVETHSSISKIPKQAWNNLLSPDDWPFLNWEWLHCLEAAGCATAETGWNPLHITISNKTHQDGDLPEASVIIAAAPCYIKTHSMGEFIFDSQIAQAAYRSGLEYYPKILNGVPFTPASGPRLLIKHSLPAVLKDEIRRLFGTFLAKVAKDNGLSSVHINFCQPEEVRPLEKAGYLNRKTLQFHWQNINAADEGKPFRNFEEYLNAFRAKRRGKIKKERQAVREAGIVLEVLQGKDIPDELFDQDVVFQLYVSTIDKMFYGRKAIMGLSITQPELQYLNPLFFRMLKNDFRQHICLVLARREADRQIVAGTFNVVSGSTFYGRYWGTFEDIKHLHFETCYYQAIQYCIERGLQTMEPGAGGDSFKYIRGFVPACAESMHYIVDPALRQAVEDFFTYESKYVGATATHLTQSSAIRPKEQE